MMKKVDHKKTAFILLFAILYLCAFAFVIYRYYHTNRYWEIGGIEDMTVEKGQRLLIKTLIKNKMYYGIGSDDGYFVSYHLYDEDRNILKYDNVRSVIENIGPNETKETEILIEAPDDEGTYIVEVDLVKEEEYWLKEKSEQTAFFKLIIKNKQ